MTFEKPELELITNDSTLPSVYRMKVPAGWVVISMGNICYVPDPGHAWQWTRRELASYEKCDKYYVGMSCEGYTGCPCDGCPCCKHKDSAVEETIEDGFGSSWSAYCPKCKGKTMQVVRPGKVQCPRCD